jgi:hypothetical protein
MKYSNTSLFIFAYANSKGLDHTYMEAAEHLCDHVLSVCNQFCRYSLWASVEEITDLCHSCSWCHCTVYPSCRAMIVCLLLLHKLTVVCQPGDGDTENYIEQLLI